MDRLNKAQREKIFFSILSPYFEDKGFKKYLSGSDPLYVLNHDNFVFHFGFNFFSNETIGCSPLFLTYYEVEDLILDVGIPEFNLIEQRKKDKYHLSTIEFRTKPDNLKRHALNSEADIESFAESFIRYYEKEGMQFIERHKTLPKVFIGLQSIVDWKLLVSGAGEAFIRVLIISKLCNDDEYGKKFTMIDEILKADEDWLPYWEKYKTILKELTPRYNV